MCPVFNALALVLLVVVGYCLWITFHRLFWHIQVEFDVRFEPGCDLNTMETAPQHNNSNNISNNSVSAPVLKGYAIVSVKNLFRDDWR